MAASDVTPGFSDWFNGAAAACAESQRLVSRSSETITRSKLSRATASRLRGDALRRRVAMEMQQAWAEAEAAHAALRDEVERVARTMRETGVDDRAAVATVRAHIRFVLYDGGLTEQDAEPVVARASLWVEQIYAAA